jgi:hypothetical protein
MAPQLRDRLNDGLRRRLAQPAWPGGPILQSGQPFAAISIYPFDHAATRFDHH